jgi:hypothetical protein
MIGTAWITSIPLPLHVVSYLVSIIFGPCTPRFKMGLISCSGAIRRTTYSYLDPITPLPNSACGTLVGRRSPRSRISQAPTRIKFIFCTRTRTVLWITLLIARAMDGSHRRTCLVQRFEIFSRRLRHIHCKTRNPRTSTTAIRHIAAVYPRSLLSPFRSRRLFRRICGLALGLC